MPRGRQLTRSALALLLALVAGCGNDDAGRASVEPGATGSTSTAAPAGEQRFPDIVDVELTPQGDGTYDVAATVSSPYDTPERYADAWRIVAPDGSVLGVRELTHDHADEQPFTRSLTGVEVPDSVDRIVVEGRDLVHGWGGGTAEAAIPR